LLGYTIYQNFVNIKTKYDFTLPLCIN